MAENASISFRTEERIRTTATSSSLSEQRASSLYTGQYVSFLEKQYSIFIFDAKDRKVALDERFTDLDPAGQILRPEYFFTVAPKVIEQTEPFATTIVPTQRGGKYVESHGSILKTIRVQGTTGIRPRRTRGQFSNVPLVGEALNDVTNQFRITDTRQAVPSDERTGWDDIQFLKNVFRAYSDVKENDEASNNLLMVWRNNKDNDSWIVEPKEFRVNRNSSSPLLYDYNIVFQTLAPFDILFKPDKDPLTAVLETRKIFSRVQEFNQSLRRTFLIVSTQIRRLEGLGVFAQTQLLDPIINVTRGLGVIRATGATFGNRLRHNAQVLADELDDAIDLLTGTPGVEEQDALVRSLRRARITAARILVEPGVRETVGADGSETRDRYARAYITSGDLTDRGNTPPAVGDSRSYIGNSTPTEKVAQGSVHNGEDIRAIAGRLLGDRSAWHILVALNGLKSPYITSDGAGDTLAPGDRILYPVSSQGITALSLNVTNTSNSETDQPDQSTTGPVQLAYGRDIRLISADAANTGIDLADFGINNRGDISTVVGVPNVSQGITIKFSTETGELPAHPGFGAAFPIGSKATPEAVNDFRVATESTIFSDTRVKAISSLSFIVDGDTLVLQSNIVLTDDSDNLNLVFPLRRV